MPRKLASDPKLVTALRQQLLRDDQTIKNARNEDPLDLARTAKVSASAEEPHAQASLVIDGFNRNHPDKKGNPQQWHCWSAPMSPEGAWIELSWDQPQRLRRVQLTFDSGFQRQLTLSASDSITRTLIRQPQPETVKDYVIEYADASGNRKQLTSVQGNHQRLNRHTFDAVEAKSVPSACEGDQWAGICAHIRDALLRLEHAVPCSPVLAALDPICARRSFEATANRDLG